MKSVPRRRADIVPVNIFNYLHSISRNDDSAQRLALIFVISLSRSPAAGFIRVYTAIAAESSDYSL